MDEMRSGEALTWFGFSGWSCSQCRWSWYFVQPKPAVFAVAGSARVGCWILSCIMLVPITLYTSYLFSIRRLLW